ncbi:cupin domain-containing protein [Streptomyces sp. TRM70308]|uniref:cupin domain-containing protein n=1 Tax=Streptomyces sp. TRM70308 TaxID=3131932 RepID=UPI003D05C3EA
MQIHGWASDDLGFEPDYNVRAQRLPRFDGADEPYEGGAWVVVAPHTTMTEHVNPDGESELFYIVSGSGELEVAGERRRVGFGDSVFIPPGDSHLLVNDGEEPVVFLSLWWGGKPRHTA